jgi:hypothetical protein
MARVATDVVRQNTKTIVALTPMSPIEHVLHEHYSSREINPNGYAMSNAAQ